MQASFCWPPCPARENNENFKKCWEYIHIVKNIYNVRYNFVFRLFFFFFFGEFLIFWLVSNFLWRKLIFFFFRSAYFVCSIKWFFPRYFYLNFRCTFLHVLWWWKTKNLYKIYKKILKNSYFIKFIIFLFKIYLFKYSIT